MNYQANGKIIELETPIDFDFDQCLVYLARSDIECLHRVIGHVFYKVLDFQGKMYMIKVYAPSKEVGSEVGKTGLKIEILNASPEAEVMAQIADYVWKMLDLDINLSPFYDLSTCDPILNGLVLKYKGLRIIKILDLYESLCWAIMGQQINLKFAYTLKRRICENYGKVFQLQM